MLLVIMSTVIFTACGGDSSGPTEESLKDSAEALGAAIVNGDYSELYELGTSELKSRCSKEEFLSGANAAIMAGAVSMDMDEDTTPKQLIRASMGIDEDVDVEVRVSNVEVTGNQGAVLIEFYLDGNLFAEDDSDMWVFADGQWGATGSDS